MSRYDAERALTIYKTFTKQTSQVVEYLSTARMYEHATRLEIPKLKHAPTSLAGSLEEYLNDKDFEVNRRQYLAQIDAKKNKKSTTNGTSQPPKSSVVAKPEANKSVAGQSEPTKPEPKGPAPDLIDFFDSIEQNQQPMTFGAPQQNAGFQPGPQFQHQQFPQQPNGFLGQQSMSQQQISSPTNNNPTSNPFGQPPQQQLPIQNFGPSGFDPFQQQTQQPQHNPIFSSGQNGFSSSEPFDKSQSQISAFANGFTSQPPQQPGAFQQSDGQPQQLQQQPFAPQQQPTGQQSTNPFRQSMFSQTTGATSSTFSSAPPTSNPLSYQSTSSSFPGNTNTISQVSYQPTSSSVQNGMNNNSFTPTSPQRSSTNPFARNTASPFTSPPPPQPQQQQQYQPQSHPSIQPQRTGTNPFARSTPPSSSGSAPPPQPLMPQQTGSTNPFRQSAFPTGGGNAGGTWGTTTIGGAPVDTVPTIPVFPRTGGGGQQQGQQFGPLL